MKRPGDGVLSVREEFKAKRTRTEHPPQEKSQRTGQNKNRRIGKSFDQVKLCMAVATGKECTKDLCKQSHDVAAFIASKESDIGSECALFNTFGYCRFGIKCRFSGAHTDADGKQIVRQVVVDESLVIRNMLPESFLRNVRKKQFKLDKSEAFKIWHEAQKSDNLQQNQNNVKPKTGAFGGGKKNVLNVSCLANAAASEQASNGKPVPSDDSTPVKVELEKADVASGESKDSLASSENAKTDEKVVISDAVVESVTANEDEKVAKGAESESLLKSATTTHEPLIQVEEQSVKSDQLADKDANSISESQIASANPNGDAGDIKASDSQVTVEDAVSKKPVTVADINITSSSQKVSVTEYGNALDLPIKPTPREAKKIDFKGKSYLAPLTTVGNLPFRRICKGFGVDITCGEMAVSHTMLAGGKLEWALMRRHVDEDIFGVQLTTSQPLPFVQCCEIIQQNMQVDFVDINLGCPIDAICNKGGGSALMGKARKLEAMIVGARSVLDCPVTVKLRTGITENKIAHTLIPKFQEWGVSAVTLHGRSKKQRYTKTADWDYIAQCADLVDPNRMAFFGNGDIFNPEDYIERMNASANISGLMVGRGALIKPWIFKEFKEQKLWDISANERFDILKQFSNYGLMHWGSDTVGVNMTRRYMCEWMSFLCRYVPVGIIETLPQRLNLRPEGFVGRNDLETLMSSSKSSDWIKISEIILGPAPESFKFVPKHKSNSYEVPPSEVEE